MRRSSPPIIRLTEQSLQRKTAGRSGADERVYQFVLGTLAVLAVLYNGLIAMMGAIGLPISPTTVMVTESLILVGCLLAILRVPFTRDDLPSLLLAYAFLGITIYLSVINARFFPDTMRNVAIISLFTMLGLRAKFNTVNRACMFIVVCVVVVLIIEIVSTPTYVSLFQPAQYFWKTRGLEIPSWDKSGLFANALGFEGRFGFGLVAHRTSSLFLEQVSMANYAAFLTVFLMALWPRFPRWQRLFYAAVIVAILITNNTRTSLILAILAPIGYFLYPRMPRYLNVMIAPLLLGVAWYVEDPNRPYADDFAGRLSLTVRTLKGLDFPAVIGEKIDDAIKFADSGYTFFTYSGTLPGLILLWVFIAFYLPQRTAVQKRFAYAACLFVACSLVVGGNSIFTIKVSSMLWFAAGFLRTQKEETESVALTADEPEPVQETTISGRTIRPRRPMIAAS
jgi:hypothetical protein